MNPTREANPVAGKFLTGEWRTLVMLNFEIDPAVLAPRTPAGTTLDRWLDRALVSVVGFRFLHTRVHGLPIPYHRDFEEVNLRFYVRRECEDGDVRRGVCFVRELVPRPAIAWLARVAYDEPYRALPMRSTVPAIGAPGRACYEWRIAGAWERVAATAVGTPAMPAGDSEAAFITEHYWGYTARRDGGTTEYQVTHPSWRVWSAVAPELRADLTRLCGAAFASALSAAPVSTWIAEGSAVAVGRPRRLAGASTRGTTR